MDISTEVAQIVTYATSGWLSPRSPIRVRFANPMAKPDEISSDSKKPKKISKKLFAFSPSIKGFAYWEDPQNLVFKPSTPWKMKTTYRGVLDIGRLLPEKKGKSSLILPLEFQVTTLAILSFEGDFELVNDNDPKQVIYQGKIEFSDSVHLEALEKASDLSLGSKKWNLKWDRSPSGKVFTFKSTPIARDTVEKSLRFSIKKSTLFLPEDFIKSLFLPAITEMKVTNFIVKTGDNGSTLEITFSDLLDQTKSDPCARIVISPEISNPKISAMGNTIYITANFEFGKSYTIRALKGVRSRWGTVLKSDFEKLVTIEDIKPQMRFTTDGVFVPSANEQKIRFETVNLRRVHLNIKKVFESNLGQFLQTEELSGKRTRHEGFDHWEMRRVGVDVVNRTLEIGDRKNVWLCHELDLRELLKKDSNGLYLISLRFERKDMMYKNLENESESYYESNEPGSWNYMYQYGQIHKPVIFTDIGLTCKAAEQRFLVFATHLLTASPLSGVTVRLRTFQNQVIQEAQTNDQGMAEFSSVTQEVFYIEAEKDGQKSALKLSEMAWNLSGFDTGGEQSAIEGIRTFIYTDRGVYRPGDTLHIGLIARNEEGSFPDNHPVQVTIFNPQRQVALKKTFTNAREGFYTFSFATNPEDPTGQWRAEFRIGGQVFVHPLRIETIVPYTLKVEIQAEKQRLTSQDPTCMFSITASTLFGAPASHYPAKLEFSLQRKPRTFSSFKDFVFDNPNIEFKPITEIVWSGVLNAEGKEKVQWKLPSLGNVPCGLEAMFAARVIEKSGRPNVNTLIVPVDPYLHYVGIKPFIQQEWIRTKEPLQIPVVLVDLDGKPIPGQSLSYRLYQNRQYWWWEYESESVYRIRFKSDTETRLIKQGVLISEEKPVSLSFTAEDQGTYFLEIQHGKNGHIGGLFFSAYSWGEIPVSAEGADVLVLESDKKEYAPGEKAVIRFPCPNTGAILVTVEKGNTVLSSQWVNPPKSGNRTECTIPITEKMLPNAYVTVSVIQPHEQTRNDRPIRMYGVLPLRVSDPSTRQEIELVTPSYFEPKKKCTVELRTKDNRSTQFTLAVVDEGLLALTRFSTPDPWNAFYKKERLGVNTYDIFSEVVGANKGDVFQTFSIGGSMEERYRESQLGAEKVRRFKPVVIFKGPMYTDSRGHATVTFTMPNYIGAVRIMAIAAKGKVYGSVEQTVPVKSDLMVQASLPRVLGPGDRIRMPVTLFAMEKDIGSVEVTLSANGPMMVLGETQKRLEFSQSGEKDVFFELQAKKAVGVATITVKARSGKRIATSSTEIAVRASSPRLFESQIMDLKAGQKIQMVIPNKGLEGTNTAKLILWRRPPLKLGSRLNWLIHYPYGCIEQTVSTVFPQLYLKVIFEDKKWIEKIDKNIQGGILRLRKFQLYNGAFSYWPGGKEPCTWATDYAGRFLVEARQLGYAVPEDLFQNWLNYEKQLAVSSKDPAFIKAHRLYLLSLAGAPQMAPMNVLYEDSLRVMNDVSKWLLAGAYHLAGVPATAQAILGKAGIKVDEARKCFYWWMTYGTGLRDRALILEMAVLFERWPEANLIVDEIARALSSSDWFSTHTLGHMLLGIGKYIKARESGKGARYSGTLVFPEGKTLQYETDQIQYTVEIQKGFGKSIEISLSPRSEMKQIFCELEWSGVPLEPEMTPFSKNLKLSVEWLDENGFSIDVTRLNQGTSFWGHFKTSPLASHYQRIQNVALVQVLPSGWEIENLRLTGENLPVWASGMNLHKYQYLDIRDDRIMWFFDFDPYQNHTLDFLVKLNAVTVGSFTCPPALVEAMYDANYQARQGGGKVVVEP